MNETEKLLRDLAFSTDSGRPVALEIADALTALIEDGSLPPGLKLPPTGELAELIGVSRQVTQDALSLLAKHKRVRRKRRLGTVIAGPPDRPTIGLLTAIDTALPLQANFGWVIAQEFLEVVENRGYSHREYVIPREKNRRNLPELFRRDVRERRVDGVLVGAVYYQIVEEFVQSVTIPVLQLEGDTGSREALEEAVRWIWRQGGRRPALIVERGESGERFGKPFLGIAGDCGMSVNRKWILQCMSRLHEGHRLCHELLEVAAPPDSLLIMDDMVAYGLIEEALRCGIALDYRRVVIMVNKGSALRLPAVCPRVELDWRMVIENVLDRCQHIFKSSQDSAPQERTVFRFRPPGEPRGGVAEPLAHVGRKH